jgi:DNA-binding transcriptional LysR family regulator
MLAQHGCGVALVEPLMLRTMPFPHLVARPLDPPITFETVLVRPRGTPDSTLLQRFVAHLRGTLVDEGIGIHPAPPLAPSMDRSKLGIGRAGPVPERKQGGPEARLRGA